MTIKHSQLSQATTPYTNHLAIYLKETLMETSQGDNTFFKDMQESLGSSYGEVQSVTTELGVSTKTNLQHFHRQGLAFR
ncbi:hypothetical protein M8J75_002629 [Diaphorina citri]|nr:hypothetical protein M8J75_002629 [Diaphorina citri]